MNFVKIQHFVKVYIMMMFLGALMGTTMFLYKSHSFESLDLHNQRIIKRSTALCNSTDDCGSNQICKEDGKLFQCQCKDNWVDYNGTDCSYQQRPKLNAFLASILGGGLGADWFYLSRGDAGYIVGGIFKILTLNGCTIWWWVDWIRILCDAFPDGNGMPLTDW